MLMRLLGEPAGQLLAPGVTFVRVLMNLFRKPAGQLLAPGMALVRMDMGSSLQA